MSEKLDHYTPTQTTLHGVQRQLVEAGIEPEQIPSDWLFAIVAATRKWIAETGDGAQDAAGLLGLEWFPGDPSNEYKVLSHFNAPDKVVKPENVLFFRGVMVGGGAIPFSTLRISKRGSESCDSCGIIQYCVKTTRDPALDRLTSLCNTCMVGHESFVVKDQGDPTLCARCAEESCSYHPSREFVRPDRKFG